MENAANLEWMVGDNISYCFKAICSNDCSSSHWPSFCKILTQKLESINVKNRCYDKMNLIVMLIRAPQTPFVFSHLQAVCFQQLSPAVLLQRTASGSLQIWAEHQDSREPKTVEYGNMKARFPYFRLGQAPSFLAGSYFLWDRWLASSPSLSCFPHSITGLSYENFFNKSLAQVYSSRVCF